jgi:hypothetical protein
MVMKSNAVIGHTVDLENARITFTVLGAGEVVLDVGKVHEENMTNAAYHGLVQRVSDAAAMSRARADGTMIPREELAKAKLAAMKELVEHYESGTAQWARVREGGTGFGQSVTLLAIAKVRGLEFAEAERLVGDYAKVKFAGDMKKTLAFFRTSGSVAEEIARMRAAAVKVNVDADAELEKLKAE